MPITKSAKKSLKVSRVKRAQNVKTKIALSKALKNVDEKNVNKAVSTIDKAAKTGVIHKNKAARMKSALAKKMATPASEKVVVKPAKKSVSKSTAKKVSKAKAKSKAKTKK